MRKKKLPRAYFWDIKKSCLSILKALTSHPLTAWETTYTSKMIDTSKDHRLSVVKSLDSDYRELIDFRNNALMPAKYALEDMIKTVDEEIETARRKKDIIKK